MSQPTKGGNSAAGLPSSMQHRETQTADAGFPPEAPGISPVQIAKTPNQPPSSPLPGRLKRTDSIHFTEDTENFIIGDRVWVNGTKPGKIQFLGETKFQPGDWAGVVLDEPAGKNDGSVSGARYFQCEPNRGVFVRLHKLSRVALSDEEIEAAKQQKGLSPSVTSSSVVSIPAAVENEFKSPDSGIMEVNRTVDPSAGAGGDRAGDHGFTVGMRVWLSGDRAGIVRFVGKPHFQEGIWAGIELDEPKGKNDGSVDGQRYFSCPPNHGVFSPIAKVLRAPSSGPGSVASGKLKRSPSQESLHSNFSMQSTTSRRSNAVRMGTSSLSPSTVAVGRTGTGTAADIVRAHQEKDTIIATLTKERDLARKELAAKSNQERDVHVEIQKIQQQYVGALSAQDARISELSDSIKKLNEEKEKLKEQIDDEKRKVEDLQFQLEEQLVAKDSETQAEIHRTLEGKKSEIAALTNNIISLTSDVENLRSALQDKDIEIDRWENSMESYRVENAETAEERDRMAFDVADLNRQIRDLQEKHRLEAANWQLQASEKITAEDELRAQIGNLERDLEGARRSVAAGSENDSEALGLQDVIRTLEADCGSLQSRWSSLDGERTRLEDEKELFRQQAGQLEGSLNERRNALRSVFDTVGERAPEEGKEVPALIDLLTSLRNEIGKSVEAGHDRVEHIEQVLVELRAANDALQSEVSSTRADMNQKTEQLRLAETTNGTVQFENENLRRALKDAEEAREKESLDKDKVLQANLRETKKLLEDKSREVDTLAYQLSELNIELSELKNSQREIVDKSHIDHASVIKGQKEEVDRLMQNHSAEVGGLKRDFESQNSALKARLEAVENELQSAVAEKSNLNAEIGRFFEVLRAKDVELKEAREHIEKSFAQEHEENARLAEELAKQEEKVTALALEARTLKSSLATRNTEFSVLSSALEHKDRDLVLLQESADEVAQRCTSLENESQGAQAAYAEQMMRLDVRRQEEVREVGLQKEALGEEVRRLHDQITAFSGDTSEQIQSIREHYERELIQVKNLLSEKADALSSHVKQVEQLQSISSRLTSDFGRLEGIIQEKDVALERAQQDLHDAGDRLRARAEELSGIQKAKTELELLTADKDREVQDTSRQLEQARRDLGRAKADLEALSVSHAEQMKMAQLRTEELHDTVANERSAMNDRIRDLERQLSNVVLDGSSQLETIREEMQQKLAAAEDQISAKSTALQSVTGDLAAVRADVQNLQRENDQLVSSGQENQKRISDMQNDLQRVTAQRAEAENRIRELELITSHISTLERIIKDKSDQLVAAERQIASVEKHVAESHDLAGSLSSAVKAAKDLAEKTEQERVELQKQNASLISEQKELKEKFTEVTALKSEIERLHHEKVLALQEMELQKNQQLSQQNMIATLQQELVTVRKSSVTGLHAKDEGDTTEMSGDQRTIDTMISRELDRVRAEVEMHRKIIQQKDSEISNMKSGTRQVVQAKDSELSSVQARYQESEAALRREKIQRVSLTSAPALSSSAGDSNEFQVQILNSIIADQQTKIAELEKRVKESSSKTGAWGDVPSKPVENNGLPARRLIRLYCGTCQQFDLHDSKDCPKQNAPVSSPERERKPKLPPRPRRKYCSECELFDKHETEECKLWLEKNPPRVPLRPTGLIPSS